MIETFLICALAVTQIARIWLYSDLFSDWRAWVQAKNWPFLSYHLLCPNCVPLSIGFVVSLSLFFTQPVMTAVGMLIPHTLGVSLIASLVITRLLRESLDGN